MDSLYFRAEEKRNKQEVVIKENIREQYEKVKQEILETKEKFLKPKTIINVAVARKLREEGFKVNQEAFQHSYGGTIGTISKYVIYWDKEYEEHERGTDEVAWLKPSEIRMVKATKDKNKTPDLTDRIIKFFMGEEI